MLGHQAHKNSSADGADEVRAAPSFCPTAPEAHAFFLYRVAASRIALRIKLKENTMIGYYNYTVILTYIGTLSGFTGITFLWKNNLKMALICLLLATFCDMFDGKIASTMDRTRAEKRFGIQIDSLSDLICFGALPSLIVYYCSRKTVLHILISGLYLLCALIRLAWFNVDEEERQDTQDGGREVYLGLPVTTSGGFIPLFIAAVSLLGLNVGMMAPWFLLVLAIAFVTPFQLKKPGKVGLAIVMLCGILTLTLVLRMG